MDRVGVEAWLKKCGIKNYTIEVVGDFSCGYNRLSSLESNLISVGWKFYCNNNEICESELLLYGYDYAGVKNYYVNKKLNEKLSGELSGQVDLVKRKKI